MHMTSGVDQPHSFEQSSLQMCWLQGSAATLGAGVGASVELQSPRPASKAVVRPPVTHMTLGVDQPHSFTQPSLHRIKLQASEVGAGEGTSVQMMPQQVVGQASRIIAPTGSVAQQSSAEQPEVPRSSGQSCVGSPLGVGVGSEVVGTEVVGSEVVGSEVVGSEVLGNIDGSTVGAGVGADDRITIGVGAREVVGAEVVGTDVVVAEVLGSEVLGNVDGSTVGAGVGADDRITIGVGAGEGKFV